MDLFHTHIHTHKNKTESISRGTLLKGFFCIPFEAEKGT